MRVLVDCWLDKSLCIALFHAAMPLNTVLDTFIMSQTVRMIFTKGQLGIIEFGTRWIILLHGLIIRCWLYLQLFQSNNQRIQLLRRAMLHKSDQWQFVHWEADFHFSWMYNKDSITLQGWLSKCRELNLAVYDR